MTKNELSGKTYNEQLAQASSLIGQKLLAYISHGENINDRIKEKFKDSLIFIGDEGQIYSPRSNTYIGIGQTAYTQTVTYIESAHEKIDTLNKMLSSSMVSTVWANWSEEEWKKNASNYSSLDKELYATNDIVIKGIGDYDIDTHQRARYEGANITDKEVTTASQKKILNTHIQTEGNSPYATSGITVSLEKGAKRYMFTYTFTTPDCIPGASSSIWTEADSKYGEQTTSYTKQVTLYYTLDEYNALKDSISVDSLGTFTGSATRTDKSGNGSETIVDTAAAFKAGLTPVYEDTYTGTPSTDPSVWNTASLLKQQLFKQNVNTLTIDDKKTWSYIASAYSYTLNFSKEYTDYQVTRIYKELLGESGVTMIPVSYAQVAERTVNPSASFDVTADSYNNLYREYLDESTGEWVKTNVTDGDSVVDSVNLSQYTLNQGSLYVVGSAITQTDSSYLNSVASEQTFTVGGSNVTVYPWYMLQQVAKDVETYVKNYYDNLKGNETSVDSWETVLSNALKQTFSVTSYDGTSTYALDGSSVTDWNSIYFMGYERDTTYPTDAAFTANKGNVDSVTGTVANSNPYADTKYSLGSLYKIVDSLDDISALGDQADLYVVNTKWVQTDVINLADGINTLKEVAYVLDMITDGWGNQYTDGEQNGILLTYTIANNHERIEDHEQRIQSLEGGQNVVKGIGKLDDLTSEFVKINLQSDILWQIDTTNYTISSVDAGVLDETIDWLGKSGESIVQIPQSYIITYNSQYKNFLFESSLTHETQYTPTAPSWSQFGLDSVGQLTLLSNGDVKDDVAYFTTCAGITYPAKSIPSYVGHVGVGIDLKLAQTYTVCDNNHGEDGFVAVDVRSSDVIKTGVKVFAHLPQTIGVSSNISYNTSVNDDSLRYSETITSVNSLNDTDKALLEEQLGHFNLTLDKVSLTSELVTSDLAYSSFDYTFVVNPIAASDTTTYTGKLYDASKVAISGDSYEIPATSEDKFYIRKNATTRTGVDLSTEGLTTTSWVSSYISGVVDDVKDAIKDYEVESYNFARQLIKGLDANYKATNGKVVVGLTQKDGIVTPIVEDLPKDELTASYTIWGENTVGAKEYTAVSVADITSELSQDTPLFISVGVDYIPVETDTSKSVTVTDSGVTLDGASLYSLVDGVYTIVSHNRTDDEVLYNSIIKQGESFEYWEQLYVTRPAYVRIDGAQLKATGSAGSVTDWTYTYNSVDYTASAGQIFKKTGGATEEVKYISASAVYHDALNEGKGGNSMEVKAHITKISDASEKNSGLVDAYDVKETISSIFEWVDLSRWDLDSANPSVNPANTDENEEGGGVKAKTNYSQAVTNGSASGYPVA